jgi:segregation and condensation protein B
LENPNNQTTDQKTEDKHVSDAERKAHFLALLEAALYVAGRPLDLNELCQIIGSRSKKKAMKYADVLIKEYATRNTALEILALKDERYVLQVKAEYTHLIQKLVNRPLLFSAIIKFLSKSSLMCP